MTCGKRIAETNFSAWELDSTTSWKMFDMMIFDQNEALFDRTHGKKCGRDNLS